MKRLVSRRPSPALVVAIVALVVAMAGTGYAASQLPGGSVGSKQLKANAVTTAKIKKNAVTGAKIKKKTITGSDINLNKLGTVPSANVANGLAPMEATHLVGAPGEPPFLSGSFNIPPQPGFHFEPVGFYKDHDGIVHLQGVAVAGSSGGPFVPIFTLPPGYRPANGALLIFANEFGASLVTGSGTNLEGIVADGQVLGFEKEAVALDGITFRAAG
jgi:hypothetical protein